ncbi:M20 aminoacylase family protein [Ahrensia sp. R2A130]|uniref:M20 aminoacylase family protein n=1 Tax=Ahrensia sp. R2A130 TaxID=744979 RepID=UPI0001E0B4BE|nr:M20 aminoacylase family protein [Ahrensia sp. R2A130]EFL88696.1 amidohydrolase [Ahrensia sp. R2A130]
MPVNNRISAFHNEITEWRQTIHQHPGLLYDVEETAALVASKLREFGVDEVVEGIGRTGVVAVIKGRQNGSGRTIGMRADMDALPIHEKNDGPYKSKYDGKMHACGHDGHTAMLLGAAKYLAETRNFDGTAVVIFQPAEEGGAGGKAMVDDGMMERFGVDEVYGLHNLPGLPVGEFAINDGAMMAGTDEFTITLEGAGAHAAMPHMGRDPIMVASQMVQALQSIVSRNVDPLSSAVLTVTAIHAGKAYNVIPQDAKFWGTVRTLNDEVREQVFARMKTLLEGIAAAHEMTVKIEINAGYPVTVNHTEQARFAADVARDVVGMERVDADRLPVMGGEDFSYMLLERPGAFIFMGNGDSAGLHHEEYDFNDDAIPVGASYWAKLVEKAMPAAA